MKTALRELQDRVNCVQIDIADPTNAIAELRDILYELIDEIESIDKAANFDKP